VLLRYLARAPSLPEILTSPQLIGLIDLLIGPDLNYQQYLDNVPGAYTLADVIRDAVDLAISTTAPIGSEYSGYLVSAILAPVQWQIDRLERMYKSGRNDMSLPFVDAVMRRLYAFSALDDLDIPSDAC